MLNQLNLKQKVLIGIIIGVIIIGVIIFWFFNSKEEVIQTNLIIESVVQNENKEEKVEEKIEESKIIVHITGEVKKTGILTLKKGSRVADAIDEAGGVTKEADLDSINLAYVLWDGQKIYIPNKKEKNQEKEYIINESGKNVIVEETNKGVNKKVNINKASQSELETLQGIGSSIASRIIEYREQNGKFDKIEDLQNVKGIGEAKFSKIKNDITIN